MTVKPNGSGRGLIVLLGMMTRMPVAGVVWQTVHYLVGFQRLGFDVVYVEDHGVHPPMFADSRAAAGFVDSVMRRFDLGDRWGFHALHDDGSYYGLSEAQVLQCYANAEVIINLHGGTAPRPEHARTGRLVYLETDPVAMQVDLYHQERRAHELLAPHCAFFTFGENYGKPDCQLPVSEQYQFKPTRQPVVIDFWATETAPPHAVESDRFSTIGSWRQDQHHRFVRYRDDIYGWSKHTEFLKFLDLPARTGQQFELALSRCDEDDRRLLEAHGWLVRDALELSSDPDRYRAYIRASRGEFTVAKDQNIRLRSGWFSDRSATYLAAGRPVVTQDTGFGNSLPTGEGLFAFSTIEEIEHAIECINCDYERQRRAATEIGREFFNSDSVLRKLLIEIGV